MVTIKQIVTGAIGIAMFFVVVGTILMPQFSRAWRYCQARQWVGAHGGVNTNCTTIYQTSNTTEVDSTAASHTEDGVTSPVASGNPNADNFCLNCSTAGGYRTTIQGLVLIVLVMMIVYVAIRR